MIFCEGCAALVVPSPRAGEGRGCECGRSVVWWDDPVAGRLAVFCHAGRQGVSVVGLHNGLLTEPFPRYDGESGAGAERAVITAEQLARIVAETPATYLFKTVHSLVIRVRAGYTGDTRFATLREALDASEKTRRRLYGLPTVARRDTEYDGDPSCPD